MKLLGSFARLMSIALATAATLALAGPAMAQIRSEPQLSNADNAMALETLGHRVILPLPDWLGADQRVSSDVLPPIDTTYRADEVQSLLQVYPKGESEALWSTLYGVRTALATGVSLSQYRQLVMGGYAQNCIPELTSFHQLGPDEGEALAPLIMVCGAYKNSLAGYRGLGEVMVMQFAKTEQAVAVVFQEWRGKAFDPAQSTGWPVPSDVVEARAHELQSGTALTLAD
ncbi:MAG TPA: hypothetical protein VLZ53_09835 [Devosia sp.]|nr:hypothetical protein [Devosia sp.]